MLDKRQKGFDLKQKEMVKDLIERFGMIEILNLADSVVGESQEGDNGLVRLGKKLMEKGLVSDEELVDFYCSDDIN